MLTDALAGVGERRPSKREAAALLNPLISEWVRRFELGDDFVRSTIVAAECVGPDAFDLTWRGTDRIGVERRFTARICARTGGLRTERTFADWSAVPDRAARVIVAPDMIAFWRLRAAVGGKGSYPFVLVAPTSSDQVPPEWHDPGYWRFDRLTLLVDSALAPPPLLPLLAAMDGCEAGAALRSGQGTWATWCTGRRPDYEVLDEIGLGARPVADFRPIRIAADAFKGSISTRALDASGRLLRRVSLPNQDGGCHRPFLVRSDRTCAELLTTTARAGPLEVAAADAWDPRRVEAFLRDDAVPPGDVGDRLASLFAPLVGGDAVASRTLAAYAALSHVYPAFEACPVLIVRGGGFARRLFVRRLLAAVCHDPISVARTRAAQLARVAAVNEGVMLLEEPGPLVGPGGPTEVGRFLCLGAMRGASSYNVVSTRDGVRRLDVFGPKVVLAAFEDGRRLDCETIVIGLPDDDVDAIPDFDWVAAGAMRDELHLWAMRAVAEMLRAGSRDCGSDAVLPMVADALRLSAPDRAPASRCVAVPEPASPANAGAWMDALLERCGSGGHVALAQVLLETALEGGDPNSMTPERPAAGSRCSPRCAPPG